MGECLDRDQIKVLEQSSYSQTPMNLLIKELTHEGQQTSHTLMKQSQISNLIKEINLLKVISCPIKFQIKKLIILLQTGNLRQFLKLNHIGRDKIISYSLNPSQIIICFAENDIKYSQIYEQIISNSNFTEFMNFTDGIGQPAKKLLGLLKRTQTKFQYFLQKLNQRLATNNTIEMQGISLESTNQSFVMKQLES
ncbi:unnamed protein product [Paramecium octaurelia]|uniref:Uncharacterized protein n=1 Tax=Paramecium octaurelia TaxID=43137 RepID=A0A8S1S9U5_PAROT|nr:unnamed protein product [Paramecium octaurelia]